MNNRQIFNTSEWLYILLQEQFPQIKEFFLYGSVSKIPDPNVWDADLLEPLISFDEESDYDFAVPNTFDAVTLLENTPGFRRLPELDYQDDFTIGVFEGKVDDHKVQIGVKSDFLDFKSVWTSIPRDFYWKFLNKRSPKYLGKEGVCTYINQMKSLQQGHYSYKKGISVGSLYDEIKFVEVRPEPVQWHRAAMLGVAF